MRLIIDYDPISRKIEVVENDFRTIELYGVLEYVKSMVTQYEFLESEPE